MDLSENTLPLLFFSTSRLVSGRRHPEIVLCSRRWGSPTYSPCLTNDLDILTTENKMEVKINRRINEINFLFIDVGKDDELMIVEKVKIVRYTGRKRLDIVDRFAAEKLEELKV